MNLTTIITTLEKETEGREISFEDILKALESRGYGPLLLVPAIILLLPTGALPGMPLICGLFISAVSLQLAMGFPYIKLPKKILEFSLDRKKFTTALQKIKPVTGTIDKFLKPRLQFLTHPVVERVIAVLCIFLAVVIMITGIIPFGMLIPALSVALFALGLSSKDGLLLSLGFAGGFAVMTAVLWLLLK